MNTTKRGKTERSIFRLELACGHTAFALSGEIHAEGFGRFCWSCNRPARIMSSVESRFLIPNIRSRTPMKYHEPA